jgi:soluble P-type ATPase
MKTLKNILQENMHRFNTKNINEIDTYVASGQSPFTDKEIKIYEHVLVAIAEIIGADTDMVDDFTDQVDKQRYTIEFKKIIQAINMLADDIDEEMNHRAG